MEKDAHIRSIGRSLAVLREVNHAGSMSMMEISKKAGIPYPTACRIVYTLQEEGMLEREPSRKRYRPTALVQSLAHGYQDHGDLVSTARPYLEQLTRQHFWPISLTSRVGQFMIVRDCTHSLSPMALTNYQPGAAFPLLECASGHILLAYAGDEDRQAWLGAAAGSDTAPDPLTLQRLSSDEFAQQIRSDGYVIRGYNRFTNTPGRTSSIAVPIFHNGQVCAALTLVYFSVSMRPEAALVRYATDLKTAADAVTLRLAEQDLGDTSDSNVPLKRDVQRAELGIA